MKESYEIEIEISHEFFEKERSIYELSVLEGKEQSELPYTYIEESVGGQLVIKDKHNDITIKYRDRKGGAHSDKEMQHSVSVKIISPKKYYLDMIEIPKKEDEPLKIHSKTNLKKSDIPVLYDFLNKNRRYFFAAYESKSDSTKERAIKQIVNRNKDVLKDVEIRGDNVEKYEELTEKLRSKLKNDN